MSSNINIQIHMLTNEKEMDYNDLFTPFQNKKSKPFNSFNIFQTFNLFN
jgi:hypothetical protein